MHGTESRSLLPYLRHESQESLEASTLTAQRQMVTVGARKLLAWLQNWGSDNRWADFSPFCVHQQVFSKEQVKNVQVIQRDAVMTSELATCHVFSYPVLGKADNQWDAADVVICKGRTERMQRKGKVRSRRWSGTGQGWRSYLVSAHSASSMRSDGSACCQD